MTKDGNIKYVPAQAATSRSITEPTTAPTHVSTPVRAPSAPLIDVGGYETESLPASPVPTITTQPSITYTGHASTTAHPPVQVFNVNHRVRLTDVTAKDVKAFMAMLESEQTQRRQ